MLLSHMDILVLQTLEDSGNVNYGGGGNVSITKPDVATL